MATPPHEQQSATLLYLLTTLAQKGARKVVRKAGNYKFGSKVEDVEDRLNEFLELERRYDEANGTDPFPNQV